MKFYFFGRLQIKLHYLTLFHLIKFCAELALWCYCQGTEHKRCADLLFIDSILLFLNQEMLWNLKMRLICDVYYCRYSVEIWPSSAFWYSVYWLELGSGIDQERYELFSFFNDSMVMKRFQTFSGMYFWFLKYLC